MLFFKRPLLGFIFITQLIYFTQLSYANPATPHKLILQLLQKNSDSFKTENTEQMMSTISQKCPAFESTKKLMTDIFKN